MMPHDGALARSKPYFPWNAKIAYSIQNIVTMVMEPRETYLVIATITINAIKQLTIITGSKKPTIIPAVVAIPFPPLKCR